METIRAFKHLVVYWNIKEIRIVYNVTKRLACMVALLSLQFDRLF